MKDTRRYDSRFSPAWNYRHGMWYGTTDHRVSVAPTLLSILAAPLATIVGGPLVGLVACFAPHVAKRIADDLFDGVASVPKTLWDTSFHPEWEKKEEKKPYALDHEDRVNKLKEWGIEYK